LFLVNCTNVPSARKVMDGRVGSGLLLSFQGLASAVNTFVLRSRLWLR